MKMEVAFHGQQSTEAIIAEHARDKKAEELRLNADKANSSLQQPGTAATANSDKPRMSQDELMRIQQRQEERYQEQKSHANDADSLVYVVDISPEQSAPQTAPQLTLEDALGDGFRADVETELVVQLLKTIHVAGKDDDVATALAKGTELARQLNDVCDLVDMMREDEVSHACEVFKNLKQSNDTPQETLLCAQLVQTLA